MGIPHLQAFLQPYATRVDLPSVLAESPLPNPDTHQNPRQSHSAVPDCHCHCQQCRADNNDQQTIGTSNTSNTTSNTTSDNLLLNNNNLLSSVSSASSISVSSVESSQTQPLKLLVEPQQQNHRHHFAAASSSASSAKLVNVNAIIDGPSLAYHIHSIAVARANKINKIQRINKIITHGRDRDRHRARPRPATPSYRHLGPVLFAWLDALLLHGFRVAALVFDGALPPLKKEVRIARLAANARALRLYRAAWPTDDEHHYHHDGVGSSVCDDNGDVLPLSADALELFNGVSVESTKYGPRLPALPFLVPAIIECLVNSPFAAVTRVVPAEADSYCAAFAQANGGTVFTSDSDLLAYDLGSDGSVMLLKDLELQVCSVSTGSASSSTLKGLRYELGGIADRFGLSSLQPFAFAVRQDHHRGLGECVDVARRVQTDKSAEYEIFLSQYAADELPSPADAMSSSALGEVLARLDPRVSEWVHESRCLSTRTNHDEPLLPVDMYLPPLIEDPSRSSPWADHSGADIRLLAYSLLRPSNVHQHSSTAEHYRKSERIASTLRGHLSPPEVASGLKCLRHGLMHAMAFLRDGEHTPPPSWSELALYWLCESLEADGTPLPRFDHLRSLLLQQDDVGFCWTRIQLCARMQALLYSWRVLRQCLAVHAVRGATATAAAGAGAGDTEMEDAQAQALLSSMEAVQGGRIAELFDPVVRERVDEARATVVVNRIAARFHIQEPPAVTTRPRKRRKGKESRGAGASTGGGQAAVRSSNMYDILGSVLAE